MDDQTEVDPQHSYADLPNHVVLYTFQDEERITHCMDEDRAAAYAQELDGRPHIKVLSVMTFEDAKAYLEASRILADAGEDELFRVQTLTPGSTVLVSAPMSKDEAFREFMGTRAKNQWVNIISDTAYRQALPTGEQVDAMRAVMEDEEPGEPSKALQEAAQRARGIVRHNDMPDIHARHQALDWALRLVEAHSQFSFGVVNREKGKAPTASEVVTMARVFERYLTGTTGTTASRRKTTGDSEG